MKKPVTTSAVLLFAAVVVTAGLQAFPAFAQTPAPTTTPPPATPAPPQPATTAKTLYTRLGGYDAIALIVDDFLSRMAADSLLTRFFVGLSNDSKRRVRQHIVDQLCQATGGPCYYIGRSMKAAHTGLNINEADWTAAVNHLGATFDKFNVPLAERNEVLAALTTLKPDIVNVK